jgi:hypothetical protein
MPTAEGVSIVLSTDSQNLQNLFSFAALQELSEQDDLVFADRWQSGATGDTAQHFGGECICHFASLSLPPSNVRSASVSWAKLACVSLLGTWET